MRQSIRLRPSTARRGATAGCLGSAATRKPRSASCRKRRSATSFGTRSVGRTPSTDRWCARLVGAGTNGSGPKISRRREHGCAVSSMTGSSAAASIVATATSARSTRITSIREKHGNLSRMVQLCASEKRILAELDKCVARCARCHRRDTWDQRPSSWRAADRLPASWRRRLELQDFNDQLKLALGCADCGWREWARGLDWDHVRGRKLHGIATLINDRWPVEVIIAETAKCDVVCANCHRIRTCERRLFDASLMVSAH